MLAALGIVAWPRMVDRETMRRDIEKSDGRMGTGPRLGAGIIR
jgi:hypothetical protein